MKSVGTVTFTLNLPVEFEREGGLVIARFPHLEVASQGHTRAEAERNLVEAAQLFIESCFERNVLDEVLKSCGFKAGLGSSVPGRNHLTVPVELLATQNGSASLTG